jgi:hypothetical protein
VSISSVGSAHSQAYLHRPSQTDNIEGGDTSPTDALHSPAQASTGGSSGDPLISGLGPDDGSGRSGGSCGAPQFSAAAMSALLSVQSGQDKATSADAEALIAQFDVDGGGQVSQPELENAIGHGASHSLADMLFNRIDGNGDGSVSQDELQTALEKVHDRGHQHGPDDASGTGGQQDSDPLQALLPGTSADGTTSQSSSNADGSTTTTISYADGTKLEMTIPAASSGSSSDTASGHPNAFNLGTLLKYIVSQQAKLAPPIADLSA